MFFQELPKLFVREHQQHLGNVPSLRQTHDQMAQIGNPRVHLDHNYHRVVLQRPKDVLVEHHLHVVVPHDLALDLRNVRRMVDIKADGGGSSSSRTTCVH